jgi:hypothetical protein
MKRRTKSPTTSDNQIQLHGMPVTAWGNNLCIKCFDGQHDKCLKHGCDCLCQQRQKQRNTPGETDVQETFATTETIEVK